MDEDSPVRTHLLKRGGCSRRRIYSLEEESLEYGQADEVSIYSDYSQQPTSPGSSSRQTEEQETVIQLIHQGSSPWKSDEDASMTEMEEDSDSSHTSTPAYKRRQHMQLPVKLQEKVEQGHNMSDLRITQCILREGMNFAIPKWAQGRARSVTVLADTKVEQWLLFDNVCQVKYRKGWKYLDWIMALRAESIRISCHTVIIYFENVLEFKDAPPLKNILEKLCRSIRSHQKGAHIFVANLLPRVTCSPLKKKCIEDANYNLLQAVCSTNRTLRKIFYLSVHEHFTSNHPFELLTPVHKYFTDTQLTALGCMVLRECFLREAGMKTYWFAKEEDMECE